MKCRLNEQVEELRREEQRLREVVSQLKQQQLSLQNGGVARGSSEAALRQKEKDLIEVF